MMSEDVTQSAEFATIESCVHDQGGGFSHCSACTTGLDLAGLERKDGELRPRCPGCGRQLTFGGIFINPGGSDF